MQIQGLSYDSYITLLISIAALGLWEGIQTQVHTQYTRNSFTYKLCYSTFESLKLAQHVGRILGCTLAFLMQSYLVPSFNSDFLSLKESSSSGSGSFSHHSTLETLQFGIGLLTLLLSFGSIILIVFTFRELTEHERQQFSYNQNKIKSQQTQVQMQQNMSENTLIHQEHLEIMRWQKPNGSLLSMALFQKVIFDLLFGILVATAGLSLYSTFDFLTFVETLQNHQDSPD